ncbi:MAG: hypothetical protein ABI837_06710 [Acidobacteriota bacterium]
MLTIAFLFWLLPGAELGANEPCSHGAIAPDSCGAQSGIASEYLTFRCEREDTPIPIAIHVRSAYVDHSGLWAEIIVENKSARRVRIPRLNGIESYWTADDTGDIGFTTPASECALASEFQTLHDLGVVELLPHQDISLGPMLLVYSPWLWCQSGDVVFRLRYRPPQLLSVKRSLLPGETPAERRERLSKLKSANAARCRLHSQEVMADEITVAARR